MKKLAVVVFLALIAGVWLGLRIPIEPSASVDAPLVTPVPTAAADRPSIRPQSAPSLATPEPDARSEAEHPSRAAALRMRGLIATYENETHYPAWSRPADGSNAHVTDWNRPMVAGEAFAVDQDSREIRADLVLDRMYVGPGESMLLTVGCSYVDDGSRATADVVEARVEWFDGNTWQPGDALALSTTPTGWEARIQPAAAAALADHPVDARARVYVRAGDFERALVAGFRYTVAEPFVVAGLAGERQVDGDLELELEVEVRSLGPVSLQATLFDADGKRAIAVYDEVHRPTKLGRQVMPVRIYGKVLKDAAIDGPYRLGRVHGYVYRDELTPREQYFARADEPALATGPWLAGSFRSEVWDSPEKRAKLAQYQQLLANFEAAEQK